jgi:transcriptional regulator with XRE-family HTH domain
METNKPRRGRRPASVEVVTVQGQILREARRARKIRGVDMVRLLEQVGVSISAALLYSIERNIARPEPHVARAMASCYGLDYESIIVKAAEPLEPTPEDIAAKIAEIEKLIEGIILERQQDGTQGK